MKLASGRPKQGPAVLSGGLRGTAIGAGLLVAPAVAIALIGATWLGWDMTFWACTFGLGPSGHLLGAQPPVPPPAVVIISPASIAAHGSPAVTLLFGLAAGLAGWLIVDTRMLSGGTFTAGVALCVLGLVKAPYSFATAETAMSSGNLSAALGQLNFNHVLLVLGMVLIVAASASWPAAAGALPSPPPAGRQLAGILGGLVCIPIVAYLMAVTSPTLVYGDKLWLPLRNGVPHDLEVLIFAVVLGGLACPRWLPPTVAVVTGAPIFTLGILMLAAPESAVQVVAALVPSRDLRFEIGQLAASGMPMIYGGVLLVTAAAPRRWRPPARATAPVLQPGWTQDLA